MNHAAPPVALFNIKRDIPDQHQKDGVAPPSFNLRVISLRFFFWSCLGGGGNWKAA